MRTTAGKSGTLNVSLQCRLTTTQLLTDRVSVTGLNALKIHISKVEFVSSYVFILSVIYFLCLRSSISWYSVLLACKV